VSAPPWFASRGSLTSKADVNDDGQQRRAVSGSDVACTAARRDGCLIELTKQMSAVRNRPRPPAQRPPTDHDWGPLTSTSDINGAVTHVQAPV
jgi:hypothetical protein